MNENICYFVAGLIYQRFLLTQSSKDRKKFFHLEYIADFSEEERDKICEILNDGSYYLFGWRNLIEKKKEYDCFEFYVKGTEDENYESETRRSS